MLKKLVLPAVVTLAAMSAGIMAPALAQQAGTKTQIDILDDRITTLEGQNLDGRVSGLESAVYTGDTSMRVVDVTAVAQNSMGGATGTSAGGTSILLNVPASGDNAGAPQAYSANGVFALSGSPELENLNATAPGGSGASDAWALQLYSLGHRLRRIVQAEARRGTALRVDRMNRPTASVP